jgi:cytochrome c-type biogenesis protein CcmH/NrfG
MNKLLVAVVASMLGLASISVYAEEVKLTDQDRSELRQRANSLRQDNALGRGQGDDMGRSMRAADRPVKAKHTKKHSRKHTKRGSSRPRA